VKVLYVAGSMRSGTTLVAELLGSFRGAMAIGELNNVSFAALKGQRCSCGNDPLGCEVWGPVFAHVLAEPAAARIWELRQLLERQRRLPELRRLASRDEIAWPAVVAEYVAFLRSSVATLLEASGASTLVDSSKSPGGLALMRLAFPGEVAVLHLLRDPRGVANSESRHVHRRDADTSAPPSTRSIVRSAAGWDSVNLECALMARGIEMAARTWYEWLCEAPADRLEALGRRLGLVSPGPVFDGRRVLLSPSHVLAGNPSRTGPQWRSVERDEAWREDLSRREQRLVSLIAWPLEPFLRHAAGGAKVSS
jgi:hypothetical protein